MLSLNQGLLEMFILILNSFPKFYKDQRGGGLDCIDIDGNSLLHLAAKAQDTGVKFCKVLYSFSPSHFVKMLNSRNNTGDSPCMSPSLTETVKSLTSSSATSLLCQTSR